MEKDQIISAIEHLIHKCMDREAEASRISEACRENDFEHYHAFYGVAEGVNEVRVGLECLLDEIFKG